MKLYLSFLFSLCFFASAIGQEVTTKVIENTYEMPGGKRVAMNLKFAQEVKVTAWERNEVGLKTILKRSDPAMDEIHQMTVNRSDQRLSIATTYKMDESRWGEHRCWNCEDEDSDNCICFSVSYEVMVPADADLSIETISGDLEIRGVSGPLEAKSISGFVDLGLSPRIASDLRFKTVTGEIYTDFDNISLAEGSTPYSKRLASSINGGGPRISLESVSGDIYFRKLEQ